MLDYIWIKLYLIALNMPETYDKVNLYYIFTYFSSKWAKNRQSITEYGLQCFDLKGLDWEQLEMFYWINIHWIGLWEMIGIY